MQTETVSFNKSDWSGETCVMDVTLFAGTWEFVIDGEDVHVRNKFRVPDDNPKFAWTHYDVFVDGARTGYTVGKFDTDDLWEARDEMGDFCRQGDTPAEAVAKLLFNLM